MKIIAQTIGLMLITLLSNAVYADATQNTKKIAYLLKNTKGIVWDTENIFSDDVAWDEKKDFIVGGRTEKDFILAIVNGANIKKFHIIKADNESAFCVPSQVKISIEPNLPNSEDINKTKYYETYKRLSIVLDDGACDPNEISWNKKKKYFESFRN